MLLYLIKRTASLAGVLVAISITLFALQEIIPADPARAAVGANAPRMVVEAKRRSMGLDQSLVTRYWRYVDSVMHGDLGESVHTHNPVAEDLAHFIPASMELVVAALMLGVVFGGVLALAQSTSPRFGAALRLALLAATSAPIFLVGLLLLLLFWYRLGWLPGGGRIAPDDFRPGPTGFLVFDGIVTGRPRLVASALKHLLLPAMTLALPIAVSVGRTLASSLLDVYRQSYIRTARAKGLSEREVVYRHALGNALIPVLTVVGLQFGSLLAGAIVTETVFSWPGIGRLTLSAISNRDYALVQGCILAVGLTYVAVNLLTDVAYNFANPRMRA